MMVNLVSPHMSLICSSNIDGHQGTFLTRQRKKFQTENGNPSQIINRYIKEATEFLESYHKEVFD